MTEEGDLVKFDVQMEFEVVNPTPHTLDFNPTFQFEKGERHELKSVICFGDAKYNSAQHRHEPIHKSGDQPHVDTPQDFWRWERACLPHQ
jgi:hypothetical protein